MNYMHLGGCVWRASRESRAMVGNPYEELDFNWDSFNETGIQLARRLKKNWTPTLVLGM